MRPAEQRQRPAQHEVDDGDDAEDDERLEGRVVDDLAGARHLGEADDRGERGALDDLHHVADGRRAARSSTACGSTTSRMRST